MFGFYLNAFRLLKAIFRSWNDKKFRGALTLAVLLLISGTVFFTSVEGWRWVDALYFSATTMSTVGLGDLSPETAIKSDPSTPIQSIRVSLAIIALV